MKMTLVTAIAVILISTVAYGAPGLGKILKKGSKSEATQDDNKAADEEKGKPAEAPADHNPLPFKVKVGGESAVAKPGYLYATVEKPVAPDAEIEVAIDKPDTVIINVCAVEKNAEVKDGVKPGKSLSTIMLEKKTRANLTRAWRRKNSSPALITSVSSPRTLPWSYSK